MNTIPRKEKSETFPEAVELRMESTFHRSIEKLINISESGKKEIHFSWEVFDRAVNLSVPA